MLVQLDKCVAVCGSDLQRGHSGNGIVSTFPSFAVERFRKL